MNASERERDRLEQQKELMMAVDGLAHVRKKSRLTLLLVLDLTFKNQCGQAV